jgi:hypothetical protein
MNAASPAAIPNSEQEQTDKANDDGCASVFLTQALPECGCLGVLVALQKLVLDFVDAAHPSLSRITSRKRV